MPFEPAPPRVVSLARADLPVAIPVLVSAFLDDPLMRYVFADAPYSYEQNLYELFRFSCEVRLLLRWPLLGTFEGTTLMGVAGITDPDETPWPTSLQTVYHEMQNFIGPTAATRFEQYATRANAHRPTKPHYHLGMIGVQPAAQGHGHGRTLLDAFHALSENHPQSTGTWLDTENPRSVVFYERCGYHIIAQTTFDHLTIWCMFRPNRTHRP